MCRRTVLTVLCAKEQIKYFDFVGEKKKRHEAGLKLRDGDEIDEITAP